MTSLDVAPATSSPATRVSTPVKSRKSLWSGGVVAINIPKVVREGTFEDIKFIQFARQVKGGVVNLFVKDDNPTQYCGEIINVEVEVLCKEFEDGRSFVYVDLEPTDVTPTHRLIVEARLNLPVHPSEVVYQVQTPYPLEGMIVIAKAKPPKKLEPAYSDDALDLRLENGWQVIREDSNAVYIKRGNKTLTHHKIKFHSKR